MNLQDLANLVLVRNHLAFLINTERTVVTKDQLRPADALKAEIDRLFLEEAFDLDLDGIQNGGVPYTIVEQPDASTIEAMKAKKQAAKALVKVENNAVIVEPPEDDKQLSLDFTAKVEAKANDLRATGEKKERKARASKVAKATAEDKEIANRIAKAKEEVAAKKAAGSFRRADSD